MMARRKKRVQKRVSPHPVTMEAAQSPPRLQPLGQSPAEVSEESLPREQPPVDPRTQPSVTEALLRLLRDVSKDTKQLRAGQVSLHSEMAMLRASISQIHHWLDGVESRFSSLEDRACETQQTTSIMLTSQCEPRAPTSSFSSHQIISDAAQTAVSPSSAAVYTDGASTEPAAPSASTQFQTAPSTMVYVETEEKALQMLADAWSQERTSETKAADQRDQQENTFSTAPSPIAPEYKPEPQPLTSTEEKTVQTFDAVWAQDRISEFKTTHKEAEEFDPKEDISGASSLKNKPDSQTWTNSLPETSQLPHPTTLAVMQKEPPSRATQSPRPPSTSKKSSSTALTCTTTSTGSLSHLASSPPAEVTPPTKCQPTSTANHSRASIAWHYFTKRSKYVATCNMCQANVQIGKRSGCGNLGTAALHSHLKRIHHIILSKKAPSLLPTAKSEISSTEKSSTIERPTRASSTAIPCATAGPLGHLASSPSTRAMPPGKHQRTSIVWHYFTEKSKYIATCNVCGVNVKMGKRGGCGILGTSALLSHLKRIHHNFKRTSNASKMVGWTRGHCHL